MIYVQGRIQNPTEYLSQKAQSRSSRPEVLCKKGVLRNSAKFTRKHLCQSLFFNKVADLSLQLYKKETLAQVFSCEFCEISKNTFFQRTPPVATSVRLRRLTGFSIRL